MVEVTIIDGGPALIKAGQGISINSAVMPEGAKERESIAICRCGKSADGVWCDGSHKRKEK